MKRALWWTLFLAAVLGLSWFFASWRALGASPWAPVGLAGSAVLVLVCVTGVAFLDYARFRATGKLQRRLALFEWLLARLAPRPAEKRR